MLCFSGLQSWQSLLFFSNYFVGPSLTIRLANWMSALGGLDMNEVCKGRIMCVKEGELSFWLIVQRLCKEYFSWIVLLGAQWIFQNRFFVDVSHRKTTVVMKSKHIVFEKASNLESASHIHHIKTWWRIDKLIKLSK